MWQERKQDYSRPQPSVGRTHDGCILPHVLQQDGDVFLDAKQLAFENAERSTAGKLAEDDREAVKQSERVMALVGRVPHELAAFQVVCKILKLCIRRRGGPVSTSKCKELCVVFHEVEVWQEEFRGTFPSQRFSRS